METINNILARPGRCLLIIFLLALALRTARCWLENRFDKDAILYVYMAEDLAGGEINQAFDRNPRLPPLYVLLMAQGKKIGFSVEQAGLAISVLAGALLVLPVFLIARSFCGANAALAAAFLAATHPYLVRISAEIMRDSLFFTLLFASLAFAVLAAEQIASRYWYLSGLAAGLAALVRSEGLEILVALFCWAGLELFRSAGEFRRSWPKYAAGLLAFLAFFLLITIPVQLLLLDTTSAWAVVDPRLLSFLEGFWHLSKEEILLLENR